MSEVAKREWDDFSFLPEEELEKLKGFVVWFKEKHPSFGKHPSRIKDCINVDDDYNYKHYYELTQKRRGRR